MDTVEWMMSTIGHMVYGNYQFGGYNHADFGKANDQVFMSELHEALSHLQPHEGHITEEEEFEEDLGRALEEEYAHQHTVEYEHDRDFAAAHEFNHHEVVDPQHLEAREYHGGEWATGHHEVEEEPSWRDDHYHDHTGFELQRHAYEEDHHSMLHDTAVVERQHEDGVEHIDNERLHQSYG